MMKKLLSVLISLVICISMSSSYRFPSPAPGSSAPASQTRTSSGSGTGTSLQSASEDPANLEKFIRILLLDDRSLSNVFGILGTDCTVKQDGFFREYDYGNGVSFVATDRFEPFTLTMGEFCRETYLQNTIIRTCDIFPNPGDEILIIYDDSLYNRLMIVDPQTLDVLGSYYTDYLTLDAVETGDFIHDGSAQIYLCGSGDGVMLNGIYRFGTDDIELLYDKDSFTRYADYVKAEIVGNELTLNVKAVDGSDEFHSLLPERLFGEKSEVQDRNTLLSIDNPWSVVLEDGVWHISSNYVVNLNVVEYYYGPPTLEEVEDNEILFNDLAKIRMRIDIRGGKPEILETVTQIKYDDPSLLAAPPFSEEEGGLKDGPMLGMGPDEACLALGTDIADYENSESIEYNGVTLFEFCCEIVNIRVDQPGYATGRGLKVGSSIREVEQLYGKPDIGFAEDGEVEYQCVYGPDGSQTIDPLRGLWIEYEDGLVHSFAVYQVILD